MRERPPSPTRESPGAALAVAVRAVSHRAIYSGFHVRQRPRRAPCARVPQRGARIRLLWISFSCRHRGDLEGLLGGAVGGREAENPCFGIIAHVLTGCVSCHSNRHKTHPPDLSCWLLRAQLRGVRETPSPTCPRPRLGSFLTRDP